MRPASEVNSALELADSEISHMADRYAAIQAKDEDELTDDEMDFVNVAANVEIARDVLAWVMGHAVDIDGANAWLCGFLIQANPHGSENH